MASNDLGTLARAARQAVAGARGGTLHVHGVDASAPLDILLYDDGGRPTFVCEGDSPVTAAAALRRDAVLTLAPYARNCASAVTGVVLAGRLTLGPSDTIGGMPVHFVALELASVVVETAPSSLHRTVRHSVPLERYRGCADAEDAITFAAAQLVTHSNTAHEGDLRRCAALRSGRSPESIIGAQLAALDAAGAELDWVDLDGGHRTMLRFPARAHTPSRLGELLCAALGVQCADGAP